MITGAGMELCWLYAWTTFLLFAVFNRYGSFPLVTFIFASGAVTVLIYQGKGWRRFYILLLQLLVLITGCLLVLNRYFNPSSHFQELLRVFEVLTGPKAVSQWFYLVFLMVLTFAVFKRGVSLVQNPPTAEKIYIRFDFGIAAFFVLLIIKIHLSVKGGITIREPDLVVIFFAYLIFSLLAIGVTADTGNSRKDYVPGFQKTGVILSFSVTILLLGAGLFMLSHSFLTSGAENLSHYLKTGLAPLLPVLKTILRFLLMYNRHEAKNTTILPDNNLTMGSNPMESGTAPEVMLYGAGWLILVIFLVTACLIIWYLIKYLLVKASPAPKENGRKRSLFSLWFIAKRIYRVIWEKIMRMVRGHVSGFELFASLLLWGRHSGITRRRIETPLEYGLRLIRNFPMLEKEIGFIITIFNKEVYGETALKNRDITKGRSSLKKLRHPAYLPLRIKTWIISPRAA